MLDGTGAEAEQEAGAAQFKAGGVAVARQAGQHDRGRGGQEP